MHEISHARFLRSLNALHNGQVVTARAGLGDQTREQLLTHSTKLTPGDDPLAGLPKEAQLLWRELDLLVEPDAPNPWEDPPAPATLEEVRAIQVALFQHFGAIFGAIAGMEHTTCTMTADELSVLARSRESRADVRDAVQSAVEELADFYFQRGPSMRKHSMQLGGLKALIDKGPSFEANVIAGIRKLSLYVDTQLLPDPLAPAVIEAAQVGSIKGWHMLAIALRRILQLEPLVTTELSSLPVLLFPSRQAFVRTYPTSANLEVPQLWVQGVGIALGVQEATQRRLEFQMECEPDVAITRLLRCGILPNYGMNPDTMSGQCERHMRYQWSRSPQFSRRGYGEYIWALIRTRFTTQYGYFEELQATGAHPVTSSPYGNRMLDIWNQFHVDTVAMMAANKAAAPTVDAFSRSAFKGLTNATVPQLVELLKLGENAKFREQLGSFTVDLARTSSQERLLQAAHLQSKINGLIKEHDIALEATVALYNRSLASVGGKLAVAAVSLTTSLPFLSTLPWLGKGAADFAKNKFEHRRAVDKTKRSLIAVIASGTTSVEDL